MARYIEFENKQIQLNLDLKLAQENLEKARDEAKGMAGENLTTVLSFLPILDVDLTVISQIKWRRL